MVAYNPWEDRRPERAHNGTDKTVQSVARDRAWQRRFKQRARRQLRRDHDLRRVLRVLGDHPVLTYCITVSGTSYPWNASATNPWEQPKRRYCAAIRKLGVG